MRDLVTELRVRSPLLTLQPEIRIISIQKQPTLLGVASEHALLQSGNLPQDIGSNVLQYFVDLPCLVDPVKFTVFG